MSGAGECPHLDPAYRKFAALPDEERIAWIRADRWIGFDQAGLALSLIHILSLGFHALNATRENSPSIACVYYIRRVATRC